MAQRSITHRVVMRLAGGVISVFGTAQAG
eukprot:COSAG05_NODE_18166_length_312_cov_1.450704_1_plen_28_part_10